MLNRLNFFSKHQEKPVPFTRFQSTIELKDFSVKLENLRCKSTQMKKSGDAKGAQSNEFFASVMMKHLVDVADNEIKKFNETPAQTDPFLNAKDILAFTDHLKSMLNVTDKDLKMLNELPFDTHYIRNTAIGGFIVVMPVSSFFILGVGIPAAISCISGIISIKPTEEFLKSMKIIDLDTESKSVVENYANTILKINENLTKYIEVNQEQHEKTVLVAAPMKRAS